MDINIEFRDIVYSDYNKQYFELLGQLTICNKIKEEEFKNIIDGLNLNHKIFVYEEDNKILASGTLLIEQKIIRDGGKVGHIEDIVVDKSLNGKGIGKKLIDKLKQYGKEQGCYKIILDCHNRVSGFYEKCGFTKKEEQMVLYFANSKI